MDWNKLTQNKMLISMLSGTGAALDPGGIGSTLNPLVQQNIAAQSQAATNKKMMQMLAAMLKGELTPGSSMKMDDKGTTTLSFPKMVPQSEGGSGVDWSDPSNLPPIARSRLEAAGLLNPFR